MEEIKDLQPYIFIVIGIIGALVGLFKKSTQSNLKMIGKKAEGVIYLLEKSNSGSLYTRNIKDKVTVRFLTESEEWITEKINQDFATFHTSQYKEGDVVQLYYDPNNPTSFYVDTKQSETTTRVVFTLIGIVFIGIGLYQLLK